MASVDSMSGDLSVALVTCSEYPNGHEDDRLVVEPLGAVGVTSSFVAWDDSTVDWSSFNVAVLRSTWDYTSRLDEFLSWAEGVQTQLTLVNPVRTVRWSCDKHYLDDLARAGAPIVPTAFVEPGDAPTVLESTIREAASSAGWVVLKPSVGAGSMDAGRFESADDSAVDQALKHARTLLDHGRTVMVQPYLEGIDESGETALVYVGGGFSHSIRKEPMLSGGLIEFDGLFAEERISPIQATAAQRSAGDRVLDALPFDRTTLLYARVDLLARQWCAAAARTRARRALAVPRRLTRRRRPVGRRHRCRCWRNGHVMNSWQ